MVSIYDVDVGKLIEKLASKLSKEIEMPEWARFVKTGSHNERPPVREDWWYIRAAAILRTIYKNGPVGISKLRSKYGGAKNRGRKKHKFTKGSGKVIRTIVQQLEEKGYFKRAPKGKGRLVTSAGQSLLEKTASEVYTKFTKKVVAKATKVVPVEKIVPAKVAKPVEKVAPKKEVKTASAPIEKKSVKKVVKKAVKPVVKPKKAPVKKVVAKKAVAKKVVKKK
jgi:small subunit ribosomal protein S19e